METSVSFTSFPFWQFLLFLSVRFAKSEMMANEILVCSEEEDPDEYVFPLTLRAPKNKGLGPTSPAEPTINGEAKV